MITINTLTNWSTCSCHQPFTSKNCSLHRYDIDKRERRLFPPRGGPGWDKDIVITKLSRIKLNWIFSSSPHWPLLYKRCTLIPFDEARVASWVFYKYKGDTTHQTHLVWRVRHSCLSRIWTTDKTSDTSDYRRTLAHARSPQYPARSDRVALWKAGISSVYASYAIMRASLYREAQFGRHTRITFRFSSFVQIYWGLSRMKKSDQL